MRSTKGIKRSRRWKCGCKNGLYGFVSVALWCKANERAPKKGGFLQYCFSSHVTKKGRDARQRYFILE
jgi:hypothetical protein